MSHVTEQLHQELDREKEGLMRNIAALEEKAKEVVDWRLQVRRRPMSSLGLAAAGGALIAILMPRARPRNAAGIRPAVRPQRSHPVVDRIVKTVVAVAAAKAMEALHEVNPSFATEFARQGSES